MKDNNGIKIKKGDTLEGEYYERKVLEINNNKIITVLLLSWKQFKDNPLTLNMFKQEWDQKDVIRFKFKVKEQKGENNG